MAEPGITFSPFAASNKKSDALVGVTQYMIIG